MSDLIDELTQEYLAAIDNEEVKLPGLPDTALRIRSAMQNINHTDEDIARILQTDITMSAHIMHVANSPLYRTMEPITSLIKAIRRIGLETVRDLTFAFTLKALHEAIPRKYKPLLRSIWAVGTKMGAIAYVLSKHVDGVPSDKAFLAGLLQDVGVLPLVQLLSDFEIEIGQEEFLKLNEACCPKFGHALMQAWEFEDEWLTLPLNASNWSYNADGIDMCHIANIARFHAYAGTKYMKDVPPANQIPAMKIFGKKGLDPDLSIKIVQEAKDEIIKIQNLMR